MLGSATDGYLYRQTRLFKMRSVDATFEQVGAVMEASVSFPVISPVTDAAPRGTAVEEVARLKGVPAVALAPLRASSPVHAL
eukprot:4790090-Amphidinium_carterae.1